MNRSGEAVAHLADETSLFARLRSACKTQWDAYARHDFLHQMEAGTLPEECFQHYLKQDYLFLIRFARAYALAAYKSQTLADITAASDGMSTILQEMGLHVAFCNRWGICESDLQNLTEARANLAYTRYVLEKGLSGDVLDLHVALSPCVIGYAEIGLRLKPALRPGHPYREWIETYSGNDFVSAARNAVATLDRLFEKRGGPARFDDLAETFAQASRLEADFWQMGLDLSI